MNYLLRTDVPEEEVDRRNEIAEVCYIIEEWDEERWQVNNLSKTTIGYYDDSTGIMYDLLGRKTHEMIRFVTCHKDIWATVKEVLQQLPSSLFDLSHFYFYTHNIPPLHSSQKVHCAFTDVFVSPIYSSKYE